MKKKTRKQKYEPEEGKIQSDKNCIFLLCAMISDDRQFSPREAISLFLDSHYPFPACVWRWEKQKGMEDRGSFKGKSL